MSTDAVPRTTPRQRIFDAAITLFHRQGYNATSLRQIADEVGLQVGSLYNHISSKEELLFDIMRSVMIELMEHTENAIDEAGDDPVDRLNAFLRVAINFHATRQEQTFIGNTELRGLADEHRAEVLALRDEYEATLKNILQQSADEGRLVVEDIQIAAFAALAMCTSVATWYRPDGRLSLTDLEAVLPRQFGPLRTAQTTPP